MTSSTRTVAWMAALVLSCITAGLAWRLALPAEADVASLEMRALAGADEGALRTLEKAAWLGSVSARVALGQVLLGRRHAGHADVERGIQSLQKASAAGSGKAHLELGKVYLKGIRNLPADYVLARRHFEAAAAQGLPGSAYYLALMHRNGQGMPRDAAAAAHWMEVAANGGVPSAMFLLANMALNGEGMAADAGVARAWLERASELEHPEASQMMALALRDGSMGFPLDERRAGLQMMEAAHALRHRPAEP